MPMTVSVIKVLTVLEGNHYSISILMNLLLLIIYLTYVHLKSSSQFNLCLINNIFNYLAH